MKNFVKIYWVSIVIYALSTACANFNDNKLQVSNVFTDNMVLQRNENVNIWGTCRSGETVSITFHGDSFSTVADKYGNWKTVLNKYAAGGPFEMNVFTKTDTITLNNILLGDVWLASGQSNMSLNFAWGNMKKIYDSISPLAYNANIRLLQLEKDVSSVPEKDILKTPWKICDSVSMYYFSAVAYFFAKELYENRNVPIGIINSSWGGTRAEAWTSYNTLKTLPDFKNAAIKAEASKLNYREIREKDGEISKEIRTIVDSLSVNINQEVIQPGYNDKEWENLDTLKNWKNTDLESYTGYMWYRKTINIPAEKVNENFRLYIGKIWYMDKTFINGTLVGETNERHIYREYDIPSGILKAGENCIAIRVFVPWGIGGFYTPDEGFCLKSTDSDFEIFLLKNWKYSKSIEPKLPVLAKIHDNGASIYNAMISPLIPFNIKGVIWYQGESNAVRAYQYRTLLPALINDWRTEWNKKELPFIVVQLANFGEQFNYPTNSTWAELREAQLLTAEKDDNVGLVVIVDIGEKDNIHPSNKEDVGKRLALSALKIAYNDDILSSGPIYKEMKVEGNSAILSFENVGSGLKIKPLQKINGFAIAGEDSVFHWAKVRISGDKLVINSDEVERPIAVRYAWDNAPFVSLFNKDGLPASPFRTDDWDGITINEK